MNSYFVYSKVTGVIRGRISSSKHQGMPDVSHDPNLAVAEGTPDAETQLFNHATQTLIAKPELVFTIATTLVIAPAIIAFSVPEDVVITAKLGERILWNGDVPAGAHELDVRDAGTYTLVATRDGQQVRRVTVEAT